MYNFCFLERSLQRIGNVYCCYCRSQWPCGLRRRSAAARWLRLRVRIPPEAGMSFSCECCVLSGRGLCVWLITRPEESYRVWCAECDFQTTTVMRPIRAVNTWEKINLVNERPWCILLTLTTEVRVQSRANICGISGRQNGSWRWLLASTVLFIFRYYFINASHLPSF